MDHLTIEHLTRLREAALSQAAHDYRGDKTAEDTIKRASAYFEFLATEWSEAIEEAWRIRFAERAEMSAEEQIGSDGAADESADDCDIRILGQLSYSTAALIRRAARSAGMTAVTELLNRGQVAIDA